MLKSAPHPPSLPLPPPTDIRFRPRPGPGLSRHNQIYPNVTPVKKVMYPCRTKLPPKLGVNTFLKKGVSGPADPSDADLIYLKTREEEEDETGEIPSWEPHEIRILSSLFEQRIFRSKRRKRVIPSFSVPVYLPPPPPHRLVHVGVPKQKKRGKTQLKQSFKDREFLLGLARKIGNLPRPDEVPGFLDKWALLLRPGSLSLTVRELGHMGYPDHALKVFIWTKTQPHLFPDDRVLASTVEVLGSSRFGLKLSPGSAGLTSSREGETRVLQGMIKGMVKGGDLDGALILVKYAKEKGLLLPPSVYTRLIMEFGKTAGNEEVLLVLLNELGDRDDLRLGQQDCTAVMTVCRRIGRSDLAEGLFEWYRRVGRDPPCVSMYTAIMKCRYHDKKYRGALALLWEMEREGGRLFNLPLYRVVIGIYGALGDTAGMDRYFKELKHAGFSPTHDIYRTVIKAYASSGRVAKCKNICREVEAAGFDLRKLLLEVEVTSPGVTAEIMSMFFPDFPSYQEKSSEYEEDSSGDDGGNKSYVSPECRNLLKRVPLPTSMANNILHLYRVRGT